MLIRLLILALGYVYPAFKCFQALEMVTIDHDVLQYWCQYWIIIAIVTPIERILDNFIPWMPLYGELKVAFIVYLWHPKTQGTKYVYPTYISPQLSKHAMDISERLKALQTQALEMIHDNWESICVFMHRRFIKLTQFISSQMHKD